MKGKVEEGGTVGRQDDGDLGGEERKIFEEPLPDMWLWKVAQGGGGVCKVFAVCRECSLFPYHTCHDFLKRLHMDGN